jgi:hypothetical protein
VGKELLTRLPRFYMCATILWFKAILRSPGTCSTKTTDSSMSMGTIVGCFIDRAATTHESCRHPNCSFWSTTAFPTKRIITVSSSGYGKWVPMDPLRRLVVSGHGYGSVCSSFTRLLWVVVIGQISLIRYEVFIPRECICYPHLKCT